MGAAATDCLLGLSLLGRRQASRANLLEGAHPILLLLATPLLRQAELAGMAGVSGACRGGWVKRSLPEERR